MINTKTIICGFLLLAGSVLPVQAATLDELYRDIVRSDNSGYLPLYVKNRHSPDFLLDEEELKKAQESADALPINKDDMVIDFENKRKERELEKIAIKLKWQQTLEAVKDNRVTPVELAEIEKRVKKNDPQAVEVYAFMYARGIGVKPDLIKAFNLYQQADKLKVPNAMENAAKVYKSMTPAQRQELSPFKK